MSSRATGTIPSWSILLYTTRNPITRATRRTRRISTIFLALFFVLSVRAMKIPPLRHRLFANFLYQEAPSLPFQYSTAAGGVPAFCIERSCLVLNGHELRKIILLHFVSDPFSYSTTAALISNKPIRQFFKRKKILCTMKMIQKLSNCLTKFLHPIARKPHMSMH